MATTTADTSMWGLYVHQAKDGTLTVVDSAGKAIATPPNIKVGADGGFAVVDTSGSAISSLGGEPITLPAYSPPIHNVYAYTASDGTVTIVDPSGKPVPTPPDTTKTPSGDLVVVDSSGQVVEGAGGPVEIPPYVPPTSNVYVYTASDGTTTVVDAVGNPVSSPPLVGAEGNIVGGDGKDVLDPTSGNPIPVPAYVPPTANIYGYISPSGSIIVVDGVGNPVPSPPRVNINPFSGEIVVGGIGSQEVVDPTTGGPITLPRYVPPTANVYLYTNSSGWTFVVDAAGNRVSSPPRVDKEGVVIDQDGKAIVDPGTGGPVTLPPYSPPMNDVYLHTAPNGMTTVVDAAGNPVSSPPFWGHANETLVVFVGSDGQPVLDGNGNAIPVPDFEPTTAPRLLVHIAADGTPEVVDATGKPVSSPPHVAIDSKTGEPVVLNVSGGPLLDAYGNPISLPLFSPPTQGVYAHVMRDPVTGAVDVQIVDAAGNLVPSPPGYTLKPSADPSDPPVVLLTGSDGKPLTDPSGSSISAPLFSPPTQGVYAHVMRDPVTGAVDVQIVDAAGNLVPSPPGYTLKPSADPSDPPVVLLTGSDGKPLTDPSGSSISAPLFSPPTQGVYAHVMRDPVTGAVDVQIVDAAGNLVPSPPGFLVTGSGETGQENPVVTLTGADGKPLLDEDGNPISVPLHPSSANPPGAPPPAAEDADVADLPAEDEDETAKVAEDSDTETRGEPGQEETGAGDGAVGVEEATSEGRSAEAEVEVEPAVSEVREVSTQEAEEPSVASAETGTAVVELERVGLVGEDVEGASARIGGAATPEPGESMEIGAIKAIGPVGLGVEELAEMVSGRVVEEVETAAREVAGPSVDGGRALDIPDLGPLELDGKGIADSGMEHAEFKVEVAPQEVVPEAEPTGISEGLVAESRESAEAEAMEAVGPVGLGANELIEIIARSEGGVDESGAAERAVADPSVDGELALDIPDVSPTANADDFTGIEGKVIPVVELEDVEFKVEMAQIEVESAGFRVDVAEAGTLQADGLEASDLRGVAEDPEEEAIDRVVLAEEDEEPDEPAR